MDLAVQPVEKDGVAVQVEGDVVAFVPQVVVGADKVPGRLEELLQLGLVLCLGTVLLLAQDVFELGLVDEHARLAAVREVGTGFA